MGRVTAPVAAAAAVVAFALAACGGGGGGSAPPPATTYDLQTGISNLLAHGQTSNLTLSGTVVAGGQTVSFTGTGTLTLAPSAAGTFNNAAALSQTRTISGTITVAGQTAPLPAVNVVDFYASATDAFVGEIDSNEYDVAQAPFTYPTMLVGGSSGTLGTISRYTDITMSVILGTTEATYAATAAVDPGGPIVVKVTDQIKDTMGAVTETDVTSYTLTSGGILTLTSATAQNAQGTLLATVQ